MRTLISAMVLVVAALVCPGLWADDEAKDKGVREVLVVERIQDLNLTDEQEAKIADITKESQPKVQEAAKELVAVVKEEVEKVQNVLTAEQKEKLQAEKQERKEQRLEGLAARIARLKELDLTEDEVAKIHIIQKEYRPRIAKAMEGLKGTLSDAQRQAREQGISAGKTRKEVLSSLNLTPDQKQKVEAACKEVSTVVKEEVEKIKDVLTAEQKTKLAELKDERKERVRDQMAHRIANFKELNLTADQKTKIAEIRNEFRPRIHEAGNRLRADVREKLEMILAVIKG